MLIHCHSDLGVAIASGLRDTGGKAFGQSAGRCWPRSSISSLELTRSSVLANCLNCLRLTGSVNLSHQLVQSYEQRRTYSLRRQPIHLHRCPQDCPWARPGPCRCQARLRGSPCEVSVVMLSDWLERIRKNLPQCLPPYFRSTWQCAGVCRPSWCSKRGNDRWLESLSMEERPLRTIRHVARSISLSSCPFHGVFKHTYRISTTIPTNKNYRSLRVRYLKRIA